MLLYTIVYIAKSGLLLVVYEKQELKDESNILPHLWSYRSRISLQHLQLTLDQQNMAKKCPLLHMFLAEVRMNCLMLSVEAFGRLEGMIRLHGCYFRR